jgi:hypothetical protein
MDTRFCLGYLEAQSDVTNESVQFRETGATPKRVRASRMASPRRAEMPMVRRRAMPYEISNFEAELLRPSASPRVVLESGDVPRSFIRPEMEMMERRARPDKIGNIEADNLPAARLRRLPQAEFQSRSASPRVVLESREVPRTSVSLSPNEGTVSRRSLESNWSFWKTLLIAGIFFLGILAALYHRFG